MHRQRVVEPGRVARGRAAGALFVIERSALVLTVFVSLAVLFAPSGSVTGLVTVAVFVWFPVVELGTV